MKKLYYTLLCLFALSVMACSGDDDNSDDLCETCTVEGKDIRLCDNGDGTMQVTVNGVVVEQHYDLQGADFNVVADGICSVGFEEEPE